MSEREWALYHAYFAKMKLILVSYICRRGKGWTHWSNNAVIVIQEVVM